jgi:hypothetical protein
VKKVFENDIVSLVKIQIYSNLIFWETKNQENVKKTRTNFDQISEDFFENNIVSLVKIQIYSNLIFWKKSWTFCKKDRTNSEHIGEEMFRKQHCFIG